MTERASAVNVTDEDFHEWEREMRQGIGARDLTETRAWWQRMIERFGEAALGFQW
jgi:Spy/CpxP family protein refolding chaperone